jgi:hypothetical protein
MEHYHEFVNAAGGLILQADMCEEYDQGIPNVPFAITPRIDGVLELHPCVTDVARNSASSVSAAGKPPLGSWMRPPDGVPGRNEVEGIAKRTKKNLDFIIEAHKNQHDVHVITQTLLSLLAIVVFPYERFGENCDFNWSLAELESLGWPRWEFTDSTDQPDHLWQLIRHLRHATAHSNVSFSSDSRRMNEVVLTFMNRIPQRLGGGTWQTRIRADKLLVFCDKFLQLLVNVTE